MKRTVEGIIGVWSTPYRNVGPNSIAEDPAEELISACSFSNSNMAPEWARIGTARVEITFDDQEQIVANRVESLRAEKAEIVATAQKRATEIEHEIQKLLAITFEAPKP